jgi:phage baseplate assembly protein V
VSDYELSEFSRQIANMLRVGTVHELDEANARVKVAVAGLVTDWIPWKTARASATRTWSAPRVGEQVMLASPYGDLGQAVVLGSIYQNDHPAPAASKDQEHVIFPDGSTVDYNSASNTLTVTVAAAGNVVINCKHATVNAEDDVTVNTETATVNASDTVELNTPTTHCTGDLIVDGALTYLGGMNGSGGGTTATINGNMHVTGNITNGGNITSGGSITDSNGDGGA